MVVDPLSAVGAASAVLDLGKAAWKIGNSLHNLYRETQDVDETVKNLADEIKGLRSVCDLVSDQLKDIVKDSPEYDPGSRLWGRICAQVHECTETLKTLDEVVDQVRKDGDNLISQAKRQMKLNSSKEHMLAARQRIQTHTQGLQTLLLVVNIKVAHLKPGFGNQELLHKIDTLQQLTEQMQKALDSSHQQQSSFVENGAALVQYAEDVAVSAASFYHSSVAGGSVLGGQGAAKNNINVAQWVRTLESLRLTMSESGPPDQNSYSRSIFSEDGGRAAITEAPAITMADTQSPGFDQDDDDDDELAVDVFRAALEAGEEAFEDGKWADADLLFRESLQLLQNLPAKRRQADMFELQYKLAYCAFHLQDSSLAEGALVAFLQQPANTDPQHIRICTAGHLLSHVYIRTGRYELARVSCESSLKGRLRLCGKQHRSCMESLVLMAKIYELSDNPTRARIYSHMVPEPLRAELTEAAQSMWSWPEARTPESQAERQLLGSKGHGNAIGNVPVDETIQSNLVDILSDSSSTRSSSSETSHSAPIISNILDRTPVETSNLSDYLDQSFPASMDNLTNSALQSSTYIPDSKRVSAGIRAEQRLMSPKAQQLHRPSHPMPLVDRTNHLSQKRNAEANGSKANKSTGPPPLEASERWALLKALDITPETQIDHLICDGQLKAVTSLISAMGVPETPNSEPLLSLHYHNVAPPGRQHGEGVRTINKTILHKALPLAALFGDFDLARLLLDVGADIDAETLEGNSFTALSGRNVLAPLAVAIAARRSQLMQYLLSSGANQSAIDTGMDHLLSSKWLKATQCKDAREIIEIVEILIEQARKSLDFDRRSPGEISWDERIVIGLDGDFKWLRKPVLSSPKIFKELDGPKLLHVAVERLADDIVPLLLTKTPVEVARAPQSTERSFLWVAVSAALVTTNQSSALSIVKMLLDAGADVNLEHFRSVTIFLRRAEIEIGQIFSMDTPMSLATGSGNKALIKLMGSYDHTSPAYTGSLKFRRVNKSLLKAYAVASALISSTHSRSQPNSASV